MEQFNAAQVDLVLFAGDLISVPPLRILNAPLVACFGDNEGNKIGLHAGFRLVGQLSEPPVFVTIDDSTRFVLTHMKRQLRGLDTEYDIAVFGHTHKPRMSTMSEGDFRSTQEKPAAGALAVRPLCC